MSILNLDRQKIIIRSDIVKKDTSLSEYQNIKLAEDYLQTNPINLDYGIKIKTAPVADFTQNILTTEFCIGDNLEGVLKQNKDQVFWLKLLRQMLRAFQVRGFLWGDLAPRNMIFDKKSKIIYIIDFEKRLDIKDSSVKQDDFNLFFRNYAYEEFSCVLGATAQKILFIDFLTYDSQIEIPMDEIKSKRKKKLLERIFGEKNQYPIKEIGFVEDLMSVTATPFLVNQKPVYPMFLIEKIVKKGGAYAYTEIVKQLAQYRDCAERLATLKSLVKRFLSNEGKQPNE